jgi:hypothetical protein
MRIAIRVNVILPELFPAHPQILAVHFLRISSSTKTLGLIQDEVLSLGGGLAFSIVPHVKCDDGANS